MERTMEEIHPVVSFIRKEAAPSDWCPGCGIGVVVNAFLQAGRRMGIDPDELRMVSSGIGCTGRVGEQLKTIATRAGPDNPIEHGMKLSEENPDMKVAVLLNDTDLIASGIEGLQRAGERNARLLVIYINNYIYNIYLEHRALPVIPFLGDPHGDTCSPFNIPHLARSCGARFVARWTPLHVRRLMYSMKNALSMPALSVIEVLSPCLLYYASSGMAGSIIDRMGHFYDNSVIVHHEPTENLDLRDRSEIIVGRFVEEGSD